MVVGREVAQRGSRRLLRPRAAATQRQERLDGTRGVAWSRFLCPRRCPYMDVPPPALRDLWPSARKKEKEDAQHRERGHGTRCLAKDQ